MTRKYLQLSEIKEKIINSSLLQGPSLDARHVSQALQRVDCSDSHLVLTFQSGDWSLESKYQIEDVLRQLFQELGFSCDFVFKKKVGASAGRRRPEVPHATNGPWGLKLNRDAIPGVSHVLCVASGKGGVGKSTVSVNLALAMAQRGLRVGLIDADLYGPSMGKMLGLEGQTLQVRDGKIVPLEAHGLKCVSFAMVNEGDAPLVWRGPMISKALTQFFYQVHWGELDCLVIDLPPGTGDIQLTMIEKLPISGSVIVSSPQDVSLIDAAKAQQMFEKLDIPIFGLVENFSYFLCSECDHEHHIFGHGGARIYAEDKNLPFWGNIPIHPAIRQSGDQGRPVMVQPASVSHNVFEAMAEKAERYLFPYQFASDKGDVGATIT